MQRRDVWDEYVEFRVNESIETVIPDKRLYIGKVAPIEISNAKLSKSMFPLRPVDLKEDIRAFARNLKPSSEECFIIDSDGERHEVNKQQVSIVKAILILQINKPPIIAKALSKGLEQLNMALLRNKVMIIEQEKKESPYEVAIRKIEESVINDVVHVLREGGFKCMKES